MGAIHRDFFLNSLWQIGREGGDFFPFPQVFKIQERGDAISKMKRKNEDIVKKALHFCYTPLKDAWETHKSFFLFASWSPISWIDTMMFRGQRRKKSTLGEGYGHLISCLQPFFCSGYQRREKERPTWPHISRIRPPAESRREKNFFFLSGLMEALTRKCMATNK